MNGQKGEGIGWRTPKETLRTTKNTCNNKYKFEFETEFLDFIAVN